MNHIMNHIVSEEPLQYMSTLNLTVMKHLHLDRMETTNSIIDGKKYQEKEKNREI